MKVDLILITYKPDKDFLEVVESMSKQSVQINKIIVFNTEQKYFDRIIYSGHFLDEHKNLEIHHVSKREFDCGKTRNSAFRCSDADYVLFLGQDALPVSDSLVEELVHAMKKDPDVAVAYGRLIPREECPESIKYIQRFYFPEDSSVRSESDVDSQGWMTYFISNACAMYRRDVLEKLDGFNNHVLAGEDILFAAKAVHEGWKVAYVPEAKAIYSLQHDAESVEKLYFDLAVSHLKHPEIYNVSDFRNQGKKLIRMTFSHLKHCGKRTEMLSFRRIAGRAKKGYKLGLKYKHLSKQQILKLSANPEYWRIDEILRDRSAIDSHSGYGRSEAEIAMRSFPPVKRHNFDEESKEQ